jgi:hypothetical protein
MCSTSASGGSVKVRSKCFQPLVEEEGLPLLLLLLHPLTLDREHVIRDFECELLLLEAGSLELHDELLLGLVQVGGGKRCGCDSEVLEHPPHAALDDVDIQEGRPLDDSGHASLLSVPSSSCRQAGIRRNNGSGCVSRGERPARADRSARQCSGRPSAT